MWLAFSGLLQMMLGFLGMVGGNCWGPLPKKVFARRVGKEPRGQGGSGHREAGAEVMHQALRLTDRVKPRGAAPQRACHQGVWGCHMAPAQAVSSLAGREQWPRPSRQPGITAIPRVCHQEMTACSPNAEGPRARHRGPHSV